MIVPAAALTTIGQWALMSGRTVTVLLGPPVAGAREMRFRWSAITRLTDDERTDLTERVLPDVAATIRRTTGRDAGAGFVWLPRGDAA